MTNGNDPIAGTKTVEMRDPETGTIFHMMDAPSFLTKREFFAAMAMQGYLANPLVAEAFAQCSADIDVKAARCSVEAADSLIEALNAEQI